MRNVSCLIGPILFLLCHCSAQPAERVLTLAPGHTILLLDSAQATAALLTDTIDHFFDRVTPVEISIQLKKPLQPGQKRETLLSDLRQFLCRDAASFTDKEAAFLLEVMRQVHRTCSSVAPDLFPDTLLLVKIKGEPYGPSVFYTRQNAIVIPQDAFQSQLRRDFLNTMYHELFHIYSRTHPDKRAQLYWRIGFESIGLERLHLPEPLAQRLLHNPDGVDFAQKIALTTPNRRTIYAIPIIYANEAGYTPHKRLFFSYLEFSLFEIALQPDGYWEVRTAPDGWHSTLDMKQLPDFYRQIGDNTTYIIHPDEVLADNFSLLMLSQSDSTVVQRLSPAGQQLLKDLENILRR